MDIYTEIKYLWYSLFGATLIRKHMGNFKNWNSSSTFKNFYT